MSLRFIEAVIAGLVATLLHDVAELLVKMLFD